MKHDVILRVGTKLILPFIVLFAFYVQFHGDYGPGGGFQAGVIAAGAVILYAIVFGLRKAQAAVPKAMAEAMIPAGVLLYAGTGLVGIFQGRNFLEYTGFATVFHSAHEWGIFFVELGVLITVAGTMTAMFYAFAERGR
ncbi:MAG: Na(+)/H(+) antiporter subunit B [Pseudomonadota bacterium]